MKKSIEIRKLLLEEHFDILKLLDLEEEELRSLIDASEDDDEIKELNAQMEELLISHIEYREKSEEQLKTLKIYPWEEKMRYDRGVEEIEPSDHLVAFIDILGFKELLSGKEFNRIYSFFQEVADETMYLRRQFNLLSCAELMPQMDNFSDSIILSARIYPDEEKYQEVNKSIFNIFSLACRRIVAVALHMEVPVRGCITIGEYFSKDATSLEFESVSRWGEGGNIERYKSIWSKAGLNFPQQPKPKSNEQLPVIHIPVHFGNALTTAYLQESKIKNIGIFIHKDYANIEYVKNKIVVGEIISLGGQDYYALNWCNAMHYDAYREAMEYIRAQLEVHKDNPYVKEKWTALHKYSNRAPTR